MEFVIATIVLSVISVILSIFDHVSNQDLRVPDLFLIIILSAIPVVNVVLIFMILGDKINEKINSEDLRNIILIKAR